MIYKASLLLGSILIVASSATADPLITIQALEPATLLKPALIPTSLSLELLKQYCHLILLTEQNRNSRAICLSLIKSPGKKIRFAAGSQLHIAEPKDHYHSGG